jgi:uncharacterized protein YodC (DUF2158 family)
MSGFSIGDLVYLKSGSPPLVVTYIMAGGDLYVNWHDGEKIAHSILPAAAVTADPADPFVKAWKP